MIFRSLLIVATHTVRHKIGLPSEFAKFIQREDNECVVERKNEERERKSARALTKSIRDV